jgi:hypothetical protein
MTYSRRKRLRNKTGEDVYQYGEINDKLARQILYILDEYAGQLYRNKYDFYQQIGDFIKKEYGIADLARAGSSDGKFHSWFLSEDIDHQLDAAEIAFALLDHQYDARRNVRYYEELPRVDRAAAEMNARMLEAGLGFQMVDRQFIELSTEFTHQNIVVPALGLLSDPAFSAANEEFRAAHEEFRNGKYEDCIHDCCNAFESVLKVIAAQKGWSEISDKSTAKQLVDAVFKNELIPSFMASQFSGLRSLLEAGVPVTRNKSGGHGAGATPRNVPKHLAAFQLHQTAAAIVFLVEAAA